MSRTYDDMSKEELVILVKQFAPNARTPTARWSDKTNKRLREEVETLNAEVRRLRDMVCLLEDSRIRGLFIHDRPELFADVAEVHRQRKDDTHGHLPVFGEGNFEEE